MTKIFISYRREDSQWPVDRLRLALAPYVADPREDIFVDIDNIPVGVDFVEYIGEQVGKCTVLLAVIGPQWTSIRDDSGTRRLEDPRDFVRLEIAAALKRGIPVAPVMIEDARIPSERELPDDIKALARRNGVQLRRESFEADAERLIARLKLPSVRQSQRRKLPAWLAPSLGAAVGVVGVVGVVLANIGGTAGPSATEPAGAASLPGADASRVVFDFDEVDTSRPPAFEVAAAPFLHDAPIPVDVLTFRPATSHIVIRNNLGFYDGRALKPTVSQNFLTQVDIGQEDCSFTLGFGKPVAAVTFRIPSIFPASPSGVTFPAWRATALAADGTELGTISAALARKMADEPAQDHTLRTPNLEPIARVRFDSDFRLDGRPFAGFAAIVIERLELEPMP
jgi:hypothetical protein